jgi:hypothetical protein
VIVEAKTFGAQVQALLLLRIPEAASACAVEHVHIRQGGQAIVGTISSAEKKGA